MLVDLGRNDVGRVAAWGSVKTNELMGIERYSHVMHIVSNVVGKLREGLTAFDVLRAAFPAGTVSGAPKVRAMQIISELEPFRRGIYAGAVGYFDLQGSMDFCIAIRTIVMSAGEAKIQAGAGIVADSDPGAGVGRDPEQGEDPLPRRRRVAGNAGGAMIAVIDNYDSFTWNLVQYICELGAEVAVFRNDAITVKELALRNPAGLVISPGPGGPDEAGISLDAIKAFEDRIPILGVCLGHQCIGQAFGGRIVHAQALMHGKTSRIRHNGKGIFSMVENPMTATRYHSLAVERGTLPKELEVCAEAEDGEVMGVRHLEKPVFGVQFHPESILTQSGMRLLENFLSLIDPSQPVLREFGNIRGGDRRRVGAQEPVGRRDAGRDADDHGGEASPAQIASFLSCLSMKGETITEIAAAAEVMRQKAIRIVPPAGKEVLDTCGTGGDRAGTFNISTTVAFVAAGPASPWPSTGTGP